MEKRIPLLTQSSQSKETQSRLAQPVGTELVGTEPAGGYGLQLQMALILLS